MQRGSSSIIYACGCFWMSCRSASRTLRARWSPFPAGYRPLVHRNPDELRLGLGRHAREDSESGRVCTHVREISNGVVCASDATWEVQSFGAEQTDGIRIPRLWPIRSARQRRASGLSNPTPGPRCLDSTATSTPAIQCGPPKRPSVAERYPQFCHRIHGIARVHGDSHVSSLR